MTRAEEVAEYVVRARFEDMDEAIRRELKIRILDALGCALGAMRGEPIRLIRDYIRDFGRGGPCTLIGFGRATPDRAAFYNSALVRYLDFNDSYLAKGETCHASDNLGAVLAAAEYGRRTGRDLLTALAIAYQVQCRLSDVAPVRAKGFDHTTQGSYALAAGISKALGLDRQRTANALAICGTAFNALRVTRTGALSHWKGLAFPNTAFCCTHGTLLAAQGITGPPEVFEGNKGFMDAIAGSFEIDWSQEGFDRIPRTVLKKYNAEIHSQAAIEGALELKQGNGFRAHDVEQVVIDIFDVAYHIIGGGEEGDKTVVRTKEEADHSLPYLVAVALLDDQVMPEQFVPGRIKRGDVQDLLKRVIVREKPEYSRRFPEEHPCAVTVLLKNGEALRREKQEYEGFHSHPMNWDRAVQKFVRLVGTAVDETLRQRLITTVSHLENLQVTDLTRLLAQVPGPHHEQGRAELWL
jgi:2-methylcitrate dehydratase